MEPPARIPPVLLEAGLIDSDKVCGAFNPPLLSFVLINWNYASYVGSTIASIKNQTYKHFQCIVVDNGSNDGSGLVIKNAVDNDLRFEVIELSKNIGHLGAFLTAFKFVKGDFVSIVDSDDFLFASYAACHIQAHLLFSPMVGVTTSNLVEISMNGALVAGSRTIDALPRIKLERPKSTTKKHIKELDETSYARLVGATVGIPKEENGWLWFPGSSNVFRRQLLKAAIRLAPNPIEVKDFSDTFFLGTCHALQGTGLINLPLSAYRRHGDNTENSSSMTKLLGLCVQERSASNRAINQRQKLCASIIERPTALRPWFDTEQLWTMADYLLRVPENERAPHYASPVIRHSIQSRMSVLMTIFGVPRLFKELGKRMSMRNLVLCFFVGVVKSSGIRLDRTRGKHG